MVQNIDLIQPGDPPVYKEWLVTNGLGGYASGTIHGAPTRRYHGVLIAALQNPFGRMMMVSGLLERLRLPDRRTFFIGAQELTGHLPEQSLALGDFYLEMVYRYGVMRSQACCWRSGCSWCTDKTPCMSLTVSSKGPALSGLDFAPPSIFVRTMPPSVSFQSTSTK